MKQNGQHECISIVFGRNGIPILTALHCLQIGLFFDIVASANTTPSLTSMQHTHS